MYRWKAKLPLPHWVHPSELEYRTGSRSPYLRDRPRPLDTHLSYVASMPMMITSSDIQPHPCDNPSPPSNRLWACESPPSLRATILPDSSLEQCSSTEGDVILQLEENLLARIAVTDTTSSLNDGPDSHESDMR